MLKHIGVKPSLKSLRVFAAVRGAFVVDFAIPVPIGEVSRFARAVERGRFPTWPTWTSQVDRGKEGHIDACILYNNMGIKLNKFVKKRIETYRQRG